MKVEFTSRAVADLHLIADEARSHGPQAAKGLETRLWQVLTLIAGNPGAARPVEDRPDVHVFPLIRYPYMVFYKVFADSVLILHIRHAARQPWNVPPHDDMNRSESH